MRVENLLRVLAMILSVVMGVSAPATVLADAEINTADISIEDDITESGETDFSFSESGIIFDENIPDDFDSDEHDTVSDDSIDAVSSNIVHEVIAERTENERTYVNPDHSVTKVVYTDTVHYDHDGQWLPIDNSLSYHTRDKNEYRNAANSFSVSFSEYSDDDSLLVFRDGRSKAVFSYVSQNSLAEDLDQEDDNTASNDDYVYAQGYCASVTAGIGVGASAGMISTYYPGMESVDSSKGLFTNIGGSVVYQVGGGYDAITDPNTGQDVGNSNVLLVGIEIPWLNPTTPAEAHVAPCYTKLYDL